MDDLLALLCFARVVELGSFTRAAAALGISKSLVSTRVAALEARLSERLLHRTTRKITVTDAGFAVYGQASRMLESARAATLGATDAARGVIRVDAPVTFAQLHLAGPIARFMAAHPDVKIELSVNDRLIDLVEERVDVAIRVTKLKDSWLVARKLATTSLHVCAAPSYLEKHGTPERPEDLLSHDCLRFSLLRAEDEWRLYSGGKRLAIPVAARFETTNGGVLREAAIAGMGLAMLPRFMIQDELRSGRLVSVLEAYAPRPVGVYAVHVARRVQPPRLRSFLAALARELATPPWARP